MSMKTLFRSSAPSKQLRQPAPTIVPQLKNSQIAAAYRAARMGGDFYDFVVTDTDRLVLVLMDIAGKRDQAMDIAAAVQDRFRAEAAQFMGPDMLNQSDALTELLLGLNRTVLDASGGVRCAPTFLGCYDEPMGTLWYINAGHPPGVLRDREGITLLEANGIPLGLFSHFTHDAQICVLQPGAGLLVPSKGVVEAKGKGGEFGIERLKESMSGGSYTTAYDLCQTVLNAVDAFGRGTPQNDVTTLSLVRS
jgi:serine phosphatase RsbU (regulator of sigma subunit)